MKTTLPTPQEMAGASAGVDCYVCFEVRLISLAFVLDWFGLRWRAGGGGSSTPD
jgi:hypothetical protein